MSTRRSVTAFYLNGGIREIIPIYPLYAVMFGEHGITPFELSLLFSVWAATGILMEVPSGALADRFSRKWLIVISGLFKSLAFFCWFATQHFYGYMLGFVLWGLGSALRSGAWEALLYDVLKRHKLAHRFTHHYGRIQALATTGVVLGEICGGILITNGFAVVLLVSAAIPIIASLPFIFLVTDVPTEHNQGTTGYRQLLTAGFREAFSNQAIFFILLITTLLLVAFGVYDEFVPPVLQENNFTLAQVAFLAAPIYLAQALGNALAGRFDFLSMQQLLAIMAAAALVLLAAAFASGLWVTFYLCGFFLVFGLASSILAGKLQQLIEGPARATVTSTIGLGDGIGAILWFMIFGVVADSSSMIYASGVLAILMLVSCIVFYWLARNWRLT